MERKFFAITVACLITLFVITLDTKAQDEEWKKIAGPWLWMIVPTEEGMGGADSIETDSLDEASNDLQITEQYIALNGANEGEEIGEYAWQSGFIDVEPPGIADVLFGDGNINKAIGPIYGVGDLDDHTSYALITVYSDILQSGTIGISSDDAFKIWLNGGELGFKDVNRSANAQKPQDTFGIDLEEGPNLLMVKVSERDRKWAMYVSLKVDNLATIRFEKTQRKTFLPGTALLPEHVEIETTLVIAGLHFTKGEFPRLSPGQEFALFADIRKRNESTTVTKVKFLSNGPIEFPNGVITELEAFFDGELGYTDYVHLTAHEAKAHTANPEKPHAHTNAINVPGKYSYSVCVEGLDAAGNTIDDCSEVVITVKTPQADLVVESIEARSIAGDPIDSLPIKDPNFKLHVTVKNQGTQHSSSAILRYYRSANEIISKSDTELSVLDTNGNYVAAHHVILPLAPDETVSLFLETQAVQSAGNQYYGAYVDSLERDGYTDNDWSQPFKLLVFGEVGLKVPDDLISQVAFGSGFTYFVLKAHFPKVMTDAGYSIGDCIIGLDLPDVPSKPDRNLAWNPGYFSYPLATPGHRIGLAQEAQRTKNRKTWEVVIQSGVSAVLTIGTIATGGASVGVLAAISVKVKVTAAAGLQGGLLAYRLWTIDDIPEEEQEILSSTADPVLIFRPFIPKTDFNFWDDVLDVLPDSLYSTSHFTDKAIDVLFLVKSSAVRQNLGITISQTYKLPKSDKQEAAAYRGIWNLEETWHLENPGAAAPSARPMSLADYPPFQRLSPDVQEYLLRQFGEFGTPREATEWQIPEVTSLLPNYPNPFNPETWIPYQLSKPADVTLTIYDIHGRVVRGLDLGHQRAGMYHNRSRAAHWNGRNAVGEPVASGLYFYTLKAGEFAATRKMLIRK